MSGLRARLQELRRYPSAIIGMVMIGLLILVAVSAVIAIPYQEAVRLWKGDEGVWEASPRLAPPAWFNWFSREQSPRTLVLDSAADPDTRQRVEYEDGEADVTITLAFDFHYDRFPSELAVFLTAEYQETQPFAGLIWRMPDGREFHLPARSLPERSVYSISKDDEVRWQLGGLTPEVGLFAEEGSDPPRVLKGRYELVVEGLTFEAASDLDARLVVYGQVHGLAGTDHLRRDIMVALLWGTPVALIFGLVAAVGSTMASMTIAALGAWYGRALDTAIQRITEVSMILPMLPILIMVGTLYTRSLWAILGLVILLSVFGAAQKVYRAMFLQIKEAPYIEAARAYGASNPRVVFLYLIPRVIPVLVPQFVSLIPAYVFLEATLSFLGLGDPLIPTWGKVIEDAFRNGALYMGHYYWVMAPSVLLIFTGLGFAMLGFALDRIFNPRLREQ
ncbi:MAG TPA: ABC transporter permease [Clostridiales bacterium]|nr:ABC transporter permease [Clostridiales bacterium]